MPDDDPLGTDVTYADPPPDLDGWRAFPVDHDPFAERSGGDASQFGYPALNPATNGFASETNQFTAPGENPTPVPSSVRIAGHLAASPDPGQNYTRKYLETRPQGSISSYDPSLSEGIQQGVSEQAQRWGVPVTGAERMGSTARTVAENAPISGNILQGNEAARSWQSGDPWGTILHGAMALPIPGANQEEAVARQVNPLGFFSHGAHVAANLPQQRGTTQQLVAALVKGGVKPAELKAAGLDDLTDMPPTTAREELADMFHRTQPQLQETRLGTSPPHQFGTPEEQAEAMQRFNDARSAMWRARPEHADAAAAEFREAEHALTDIVPGWGRAEGAMENPPKFGQYVLPGGENYREVLMHLPPNGIPDDQLQAYARNIVDRPMGIGTFNRMQPEEQQRYLDYARDKLASGRGPDDFTSSHWDTPNVVAHLRFNDRQGENGEKFLHMEELQSDWGQAVREQGTSADQDQLRQNMLDAERRFMVARQTGRPESEVSGLYADFQEAAAARNIADAKGRAPPPGPYVTNTQHWTDLGLKRALIEAANGDYTHLSWTPGEDQADRYLLTKHIKDLSYSPVTGSLQARTVKGGKGIDERNVTPDKLSDYIGQEAAAKLLAQPQGPHFSAPELHSDPKYAPQWAQNGWHTLSGQDLKVGGEGMKGYYDNMVPKSLSKLVKKLDPDAKIGTSQWDMDGAHWPWREPEDTIYSVMDRNGRRAATGFDTWDAASAHADKLNKKTVPSVEITPLMRERIKQGLPQYQRGGRVGFQGGGGLDDNGVALTATGEPYAQPPAREVGSLDRSGGTGGGEGLQPASGEASSASGLSPEQAAEVARSRAAAGPYEPVTGLPQKGIILPDGSHYIPGPMEKAHRAAEAYMAESGLPYDPPRTYAKVNVDFAKRVAQAYEDMPHAPEDPAVKAAYEALARETMAQWQHVKNTGLKVDWITPESGDPYADHPRGAIKDIRDNNHWHGFPTDLGFGSGDPETVRNSPMLADSGEEIGGRKAVINDIFRIVHDYFGHAKEGHGFRGEGEDNAFRSHAAMYSDAAKPAMTAELRGQNSWLNYGPHGEHNRTAKAADTIFAEQKTGVMPEWSYREGQGAGMGSPLMAPQLVGHPGSRLHDPYSQPPPLPPEEGRFFGGGRVGFADGGAPDDPTGYSVTYAHPSLEAVDYNPFPPPPQVLDSDIARARRDQGVSDVPEPRSPMHERLAAVSQDEPPRIMGHVPAEQAPGQNLTPKYLEAKPQGTLSEGDPSLSERLQQGVSEGAQSLGVPVQGAERMGETVRTGAEYAPGTSNILSADEAIRAGKRGDYVGAALSAAAALPIPGASAEKVAAKGLKAGKAAPKEAVTGWAQRGEPEVVWNPATRAWDTTGKKVGSDFDPNLHLFSRQGSTQTPPVPQSDLPRYVPPRGVPQRTVDITTDPEVRRQHLDLIRRGIAMAGESWYYTEPLRQRFIKELGPEEGQRSFQNFMDMMAATSPQQKVPENIRTGSYYYYLNQNKLPVPARGDKPGIPYGGGQPVASPYGGLSLWQMNADRVMNQGGFNSLENPKPPSFSQNLQGNWLPVAVDMHATLLPAILSRHPDWLSKEGKDLLRSGTSMEDLAQNPKFWDSAPKQTEYGTLEGYYKSLADELHMTPAQVQAASWIGGGHLTGLGSDAAKDFMKFLEDRVANTAAKTGQTPEKVLTNVIKGRHPLLSVAPLAGAPIAAGAFSRSPQQETDHPEGGR